MKKKKLAALVAACASAFTHAGTVPKNLGNGLDILYMEYLSSQQVLDFATTQALGPTPLAVHAANLLESAVQDAQGRVMVSVHLNGDVPVSQLAAVLASAGKLEVTAQSSLYRAGVITGWVRVGDIAAVSRTRGVNSVVLVPAPETNVGSVTQQGVTRHKVDQIAQDGSGITIGVLSDSYNTATAPLNGIHEAQDIASGDLPGAANPLGNVTPVTVVQDTRVATDEGRAMLQLIHDMAPKARLGFATAGVSPTQFAENIRSLGGVAGGPRAVPGFNANIIVDDVIFLTEPMFSDGEVARAVNDVTAAGIHYFSSAGNQPADKGYASDFRRIDPNDNPTAGTNINLAGVPPALYAGGFHNFRTDGGRDIAQTILRVAGSNTSTARIVFQWDEPFDVVNPGTFDASQSGNIVAVPNPGPQPSQDFQFTMTAGVPMRVVVAADVGSVFDTVLTILDPNGTAIVTNYDTGTDETYFFVPAITGNYTVRVKPFDQASGGAFTISTYTNSFGGVATDYNLLFFSPTGAFLRAVAADNLQTNQAVEFASLSSSLLGSNTSVQLVIARANNPANPANRIRYVWFDSTASFVPAEYVGYQYPMTYGHSTSRDAVGVAAYGPFRPYLPESFTSPGPSTITHDAAGNRLPTPEIRQQPFIAATDGGNTTFFTSDSASDADTFPNFFGTSAAAPTAASIAALVLQARGGPGSTSVAQMKQILRNSAMRHDLDPQASRAVIRTKGGGVLTLNIEANPSNASAAYPTGPFDLNVIKVGYAGPGAVASLSINLANGNTTGGNVNGVIPGLAFDTRPAASGGLPFTLGNLTGINAGDITPTFVTQPALPSVAGQFSALNLAFATGSFTNGRGFNFNVDRDEQTTAALAGAATAGGNSGDLWGAMVSIPEGTINAGGVTVTGTMEDGSTFSGKFENVLGSGYSPLDGYGFLDAKRAVGLATNVTQLTVDLHGMGSGSVSASPVAIACPGSCTADFTTGATVTLTASSNTGSRFSGFTGCDTVVGNKCTINALAAPSTVTATFEIAPPTKALVDFSADAKGDLAWVNGSSAGVWTLDGGTVTGYAAISAGTGFVLNQLGDYDGDGKTDVLWRAADGSYQVSLMNGTTIAGTTALLAGGSGWEVVGKGDFNGDGKVDLVWKHASGAYGIWLMNGAATLDAGGIASPGAGWTIDKVVDFDGDGKSDILWRSSTGAVRIVLMNGLAAGASADVLGAGTGWSPTLAGDLNGDGKADLVWTHTDGSIGAWLMNGTTIAGNALLLGPGTGWTAKFATDLNGDGMADLVLGHANGSWGAWIMNGTTIASPALLISGGSGWNIVGSDDYNGDGKADLLWRHASGAYGLWTMDGTAATSTASILTGGTGWEAFPSR